MKSKTIEIIYLATGSYKKFIPGFFGSLEFFFPGYSKIITVISDDLSCCKDVEVDDSVIEFNIRKVIQLPYPFPSYFKYNYVREYCSRKADYVFYFDADTIFVNNEFFICDDVLKMADENILLSLSKPNAETTSDLEAFLTMFKHASCRDLFPSSDVTIDCVVFLGKSTGIIIFSAGFHLCNRTHDLALLILLFIYLTITFNLNCKPLTKGINN